MKKKITTGDLFLITFFLLLASSLINFIFERIFDVKLPDFPLWAKIIEIPFMILSLLAVLASFVVMLSAIFPTKKDN